MRTLGFLTFGHWMRGHGSRTETAGDALTQTIELAVAAEELGVGGAYMRVHHFEKSLGAPFPLLAAIGARTSRIEIGTAVIPMRYENPLYMAAEAASADLISGGRLQLGMSRGSPETALDGAAAYGHPLPPGTSAAEDAQARAALFRAAIAGEGMADANPATTGVPGRLAVQPQSPGLSDRIWWGSGSVGTASWVGEQGMHLMSSTLLLENADEPFHVIQRRQIDRYREAYARSGATVPGRVSVSRSILPVFDDETSAYFGGRELVAGRDQVGRIDGFIARSGRSYVGEPDRIVEELLADEAVLAADTLTVTVPNQLGVDINARMLGALMEHVVPALRAASDHSALDAAPAPAN